jgi:hypothetical protein
VKESADTHDEGLSRLLLCMDEVDVSLEDTSDCEVKSTELRTRTRGIGREQIAMKGDSKQGAREADRQHISPS